MAQSMRFASSQTTCTRSSSQRRASSVVRGNAPFTAALGSASQAAPLAAAQQQQSRRQQLSRHVVRVAAQEAAAQTSGAQQVRRAICCSRPRRRRQLRCRARHRALAPASCRAAPASEPLAALLRAAAVNCIGSPAAPPGPADRPPEARCPPAADLVRPGRERGVLLQRRAERGAGRADAREGSLLPGEGDGD